MEILTLWGVWGYQICRQSILESIIDYALFLVAKTAENRPSAAPKLETPPRFAPSRPNTTQNRPVLMTPPTADIISINYLLLDTQTMATSRSSRAALVGLRCSRCIRGRIWIDGDEKEEEKEGTYEPSTSDVEKLLPTAEPSGSLPARMSRR